MMTFLSFSFLVEKLLILSSFFSPLMVSNPPACIHGNQAPRFWMQFLYHHFFQAFKVLRVPGVSSTNRSSSGAGQKHTPVGCLQLWRAADLLQVVLLLWGETLAPSKGLKFTRTLKKKLFSLPCSQIWEEEKTKSKQQTSAAVSPETEGRLQNKTGWTFDLPQDTFHQM